MKPSKTMIESYISRHRDQIDLAYIEAYKSKAAFDTEHYNDFCREYATDCLIQDAE